MRIYLEEKKQKKKSTGKLFKVSLIISFFALFFTLWVLEGNLFLSALKYTFLPKGKVKYQTYTISFDDSVSDIYIENIEKSLGALQFNEKPRFSFKKGNRSDIKISMVSTEKSKKISGKDLIPVGHIYSLLDNTKKDELEKYNIFVLSELNNQFLKEEYSLSSTVLSSTDELLLKLKEGDNNIAFLDFKDLDFRFKILKLDDDYYLDNNSASLSANFYLDVKENVSDYIITVISKNIDLGDSSWDRDKLVKINMAGVVAMSRGLALLTDRSGDYGYAARNIGEFLADADLTHVSNEASFVPGCNVYSGMVFCSRPEYMEVLQLSGVDIVELTGNHNNDFGAQYSAASIQMYEEAGMRYFGGGLNDEDASEILYENVNNSTIAFLGYNYYDSIYPSVAIASEIRSGANYYSEEKLERDIKKAKEKADIIIVTFQFQECWSYPESDVIYPVCYRPLESPDQKKVFRMAIDLGADIVVGSQAHQPQTYELYEDGIIFYGTGNLFFDQYMWIGTRQGMVLSHYIYDGVHIQSKITPIYTDRDLKPSIATQEQAELLMKLLKDARD
ncbi:CapA family protein [Candidatus Dojkabacteria bacterium]|nr:CapA family protein [Candidatus Dojkabacteria bacterium]NLB12289.1 CapA family protein [Candidatus Dojkabacteria bacterium]